ncbi:MAG: PEP-CTERM sorting domain-containing protein [Kiritimatiellia bacterium]
MQTNKNLKLIAAMALFSSSLFAAQDLIWDGSTDGLWTTGTNWSTDPAVVDTSDPSTTINIPSAAFTVNQTVGVSSPDYFQLMDLTVANSAGGRTIVGRIDFSDGGAYNLSGSQATTLGNFDAGQSYRIQAGRTVTLNNSNSNGSNFLRNLTGSGTLVITGGGFMNFQSNDSFSGTIRLESGRYNQQNNGWQPASPAVFQIAGGILSARASSTMGANVSFELENNFRWDSGQALTLAGPVSITHATGVTIDLEGGGNLRTISGVISGVGKSLTFTDNDSSITLSGANANTYSGGTILDNVGGGAKVTVAKDGGLGLGDVTVTNGAVLTLQSGSTHDYINDLASLILFDGALVDLNFTGTDTLSALSFDGGSTFASNGTWGATGSGASNLNDTFFTGTGTLSVIPEPSTLMLLGIALASLGLLRRRIR